MRVPAAVRRVFDSVPLVWLPEHAGQPACEEPANPVLAVYSLDEDGLPLEPKGLAMAALLRSKNVIAEVQVASPYMSSLETLPLLINDEAKTVFSTLDQVLEKYAAADAQNPIFIVYRSLIDTWLDDAWHETVMDTRHTAAKERAFGNQNYNESARFPWPFSRIEQAQLDAHLDERFVKSRVATYDDYVCSEDNLLRTGLALTALDEFISDSVETPTVLDILIFSYTWPIRQLLPDSALAALITPKLHSHAERVRQYLIRE